MEMEFLLWLQQLHHPLVDVFFSRITLLGNAGIIWLIVGCFMVATKKYRKYGILLFVSMLFCLLTGNVILKNCIARQRPCWVNTAVPLLIANPSDFSFPSGHSMHSFAAALAIWYANKKAGIAALVLATLIAFSRLYLFVHYPTDVLAGIVLGLCSTFCIYKIMCHKNLLVKS